MTQIFKFIENSWIAKPFKDLYNSLNTSANGFSLRKLIAVYLVYILGSKLLESDKIITDHSVLLIIICFIAFLIGALMIDSIMNIVKIVKGDKSADDTTYTNSDTPTN